MAAIKTLNSPFSEASFEIFQATLTLSGFVGLGE